MSMSCLGNLIWMIFGGLLGAISWFLAGCLWCVTIIGIPIGLQCFKFASLSLAPFGKEVVRGFFAIEYPVADFFRNTFGTRSSDECHSLNDYDYWDSFCETVAETSGSSIDAFWCHDRFNKSLNKVICLISGNSNTHLVKLQDFLFE